MVKWKIAKTWKILQPVKSTYLPARLGLTKWKKLQGEKWLWLRDRSVKRETESLIMAVQEQAIRTNAIKAKIDKIQFESQIRLFGKVDETVRDSVWMPYVDTKRV